MKTNLTNKWKRCSVNLPEKDYEKIGELIENGEYLNHSHFIRHTVKNELEKHERFESNENKNIFNKIKDS